MGRNENVAVFEDTANLCKTNQKLNASVKESMENQILYTETFPLPGNFSLTEKNNIRYATPATVLVSAKRTLEAAFAYRGKKTAVHNFASASNPGGGVERGASAQEECLCRCSGLYFCLNTKAMWEGFYGPHRSAHDPLHNDDIIYTPKVTVFKTDTASPRLMPETDWYDVDVITCAAPNLRTNPGNQYNSGDGTRAVTISDAALLRLHEKRLRRILDVAALHGNEVVILGAFGCGAFLNNPEVVAQAAKNVLADYRYAFEVIEYAVYCSPRDERNFKIFEKVLKPLFH